MYLIGSDLYTQWIYGRREINRSFDQDRNSVFLNLYLNIYFNILKKILKYLNTAMKHATLSEQYNVV